MKENREHPVWTILNKEKYVEEYYSEFEEMYDFINALVKQSGCITKDGNTIPTMKVFFDMWNDYGGETFRILGSLVHTDKE